MKTILLKYYINFGCIYIGIILVILQEINSVLFPNFKFPIPNSTFPNSQIQIKNSQFQTPNSKFQIPNSNFQFSIAN